MKSRKTAGHFFIKNSQRREKVKLSEWNSNPEKWDNEIQEWSDRKGARTSYGKLKHRITYKNCEPCPDCNFMGFIKEEIDLDE